VKILLVGSVPPPLLGHRKALLGEALRLRQDGHDVEIVSLDPLSAAHRYLVGPGVPAAVELGLLARRADAVVVQLEHGLPVRRSAGRVERMVALLSLAAALRGGENVTVRLQHPDDLPGGYGGRAALELWKAATRIEVGDEAMQAGLVDILGPLGDRVSIAVSSPLSDDETTPGNRLAVPAAWGEGADTTAAEVQGVVRARAAAERESLAARGRLSIHADATAPRVPQWQWLPAPGAGVPDLGPIRTAERGRRSGGRRYPPARPPSLRRAVTYVLAAAERRPVTRPAAHLARLALVELRGGGRH
jgi:hypothetical protein